MTLMEFVVMHSEGLAGLYVVTLIALILLVMLWRTT